MKIFIDKIKILNIIIIIALSNFIILQNSYSFSDDKLYTDSDFEDYGDFNFDLKREHTEVYDPLEPVNRIIYKFNDVTDRYFFEHIARGYQKSIPKKARISIRNFISNLASPFTIFNSNKCLLKSHKVISINAFYLSF